jgi:hypothetical protein
MDDNAKIGVCGIACFKCPLFVSEECSGCKPNEVCPLPKCSQEKGVAFCFECEEFPCKQNYEKGPVVKELLDYFKSKIKKSQSN